MTEAEFARAIRRKETQDLREARLEDRRALLESKQAQVDNKLSHAADVAANWRCDPPQELSKWRVATPPPPTLPRFDKIVLAPPSLQQAADSAALLDRTRTYEAQSKKNKEVKFHVIVIVTSTLGT